MSGAVRATVGHAFRRTALPLVCYYAVTLVIPLANGAAQSATFVEHALVVLVVPPVAIVLAACVTAIGSSVRLKCRRRDSASTAA